jgi:hypothetical protein
VDSNFKYQSRPNYILPASASGNLNGTLSQFGGIANLLTRGKSNKLSFLVDYEIINNR